MTHDLGRRDFLALAGSAAALSLLPAPAMREAARPSAGLTTILFQGDSITDAGRDRTVTGSNNAGALGTGYPLFVAGALLRAHPDRGLQFLNRGVSGHKVPDLAARWQTDTVDLKPDLVSILVGVNDFWHRLLNGYTGTVESYETGYTTLLDDTRRALPQVRLVVLEPFALRTGAVDTRWFPEFDQRRAAAARVATRAGALFIPLQSLFDDLCTEAPPAYWAADGVHPTPAGHAAIADAWMKAVDV